MKVGILSLQGDFAAHAERVREVGGQPREVRTADELAAVDALILPGGESTTLLRLLRGNRLEDALKRFGGSGRPVFGTCAGAILMAREVIHPVQPSLGFIDLQVERNAYGRQVDSAIERAACPALGEESLELVFIRAPIIRRVGPGVRVLCRLGEDPVLVREGPFLAATFHPELSPDTRIHRYFLEHVSAGGTGAGMEPARPRRGAADPG